ncbi:hypothetical protein GCM10027200_20810 [Lentzea nigeriaca]
MRVTTGTMPSAVAGAWACTVPYGYGGSNIRFGFSGVVVVVVGPGEDVVRTGPLGCSSGVWPHETSPTTTTNAATSRNLDIWKFPLHAEDAAQALMVARG